MDRTLYKYPISPNDNLINRHDNYLCINTNIEDLLPILESEVKYSSKMLKGGKSSCIYNSPCEMKEYGGVIITKIYTMICQNIWKTKNYQINVKSH